MNKDLLSTEEAKKTSMNELEQRLSSSESGISSQEAAKRLVQYGYNEISEKKTSPLIKFLSYFWGPIPWMIEIAAVLSAIIQHWEDFWIIFVLLLSTMCFKYLIDKKNPGLPYAANGILIGLIITIPSPLRNINTTYFRYLCKYLLN